MTDTFRMPPFEDDPQADLSSCGSSEPAGSVTDPFSADSFRFDPDPLPVSEPEPVQAFEPEPQAPPAFEPEPQAAHSFVPEAAHEISAAQEDAAVFNSLAPPEPEPPAAVLPPPPPAPPAVIVPPPAPAPAPQLAAAPQQGPVIYFIDDSATMREVMKIAFRKEKLSLIACSDAASALSQFDSNPPNVVITDVIMPDQDGYSVCSQIKQNPRFSSTPVLLMSGVVNKSVADRAVAVHADELIRKPFQPNELIARVRTFLHPKAPAVQAPPPVSVHAPALPPASSLGGIFAPPAPPPLPRAAARPPAPVPPAASESAWPRALAEAFTPPQQQPPPPPQMPQRPVHAAAPLRPAATPAADIQKYRAEILRLELLIKKLQTELQIEREYTQTLEVHCRTLQGAE
jgi:CheY-like chemotaxis protein